MSNTELSKETENPVTRQITLPLRYQADFLDGADKLTKSTFQLDQAVVPFRLNDDWSLITRTKLPAEALPPKKAGNSWAVGLSNGYTTFFLSPEHGRGFYWGAGPVLSYPATNATLGATKWGSGPSVAFITAMPDWLANTSSSVMPGTWPQSDLWILARGKDLDDHGPPLGPHLDASLEGRVRLAVKPFWVPAFAGTSGPRAHPYPASAVSASRTQ